MLKRYTMLEGSKGSVLGIDPAQKKFPVKNFSVTVRKSAETADLFSFTEDIVDEKLHFCALRAFTLAPFTL